jgi:NAD(P)-dependent dehydrogenase (short-subunit alcohol dehydrogenase family)
LRQAVERVAHWASGSIGSVVFSVGRLRAIGPFDRLDLSEWSKDFETTVRGASLLLHRVLPLLTSDHGSFIALVGPGIQRGIAHASAYVAAQAALARLLETWALERPDLGVYGVNPGNVPSAGLLRTAFEHRESLRWLPQLGEAIAEGKEVEPSLAAHRIVWLAERTPAALSGRIVPAMLATELLEDSLGFLSSEDRWRLRLDRP